MNRVLMILRERPADVSTDRQLLDRFLAARDETAFAELVRRYGPVVWGACRRRLTNRQDAEDVFQATFLVLVRRAARLDEAVPLGPWLYKVAVMTAGNVIRGNRRGSAVTGPMGHEPVAPRAESTDERLDIDAALLALPERDRAAVVLCHLQGLTRREAAERLGCPEGTLSARLSRALRRLRSRLGDRAAAVLGVGAVAIPSGLASATVRSAAVYSTSTLTTGGISPVVAGLTDGVLRMFWMKKVMTAVVVVFALGSGLLALGIASRSETMARAPEPLAPDAPPAPEDPEAAAKRLEKRLADLEKQRLELDKAVAEVAAEKARLAEAQEEKKAAAALGADLMLVVTAGEPKPYVLREVVAGKIGELAASDLDVVATYLARARLDPKGPKKLRLQFDRANQEHKDKVFVACAAAGYTKASVNERLTVIYNMPVRVTPPPPVTKTVQRIESREVDLTKYAEPKKP